MIVQFFILVTVLYFFYHMFWKRRGLPPGPTPIPILGNLLSAYPAERIHETFQKWGQQYGPLYTVWFGEIPVVAMADYETIIETFQKEGDTYAGKMYNPLVKLIIGDSYGVLFTSGDLWRDHRRFVQRVFRNFGIEKNAMQEKIMLEVSSIISNLRQTVEKGEEEINISSFMGVSVGSIINSLLFGYRFEGEKIEEFRRIKDVVTQLNSLMTHPVSILMWKNTEIFKHLPYAKNIHRRICSLSERVFEFLSKQVEERRQDIDLNSEPTNYVDAYLREKAKKDKEESGAHSYSMRQLINVCFDLWVTGQDTISSSLSWGIIYLIYEKKIQEKLHLELDTVIGSDRLILMEDKSNLPFTNAIVNEIQRLSNITFILVYHTITKDTVYKGYKFPKGTAVMPMISMVLYDEKIFPEPLKFKPERFLDSNGNVRKIDEFIPFSVGRRQCLGEGLARMEMFLFIANIFNQFKISAVDGKEPSLERQRGVAFTPLPFVCKLEKRY